MLLSPRAMSQTSDGQDDIVDEFVKTPYLTDTIVTALPINYPLTKKKTIPLWMLADENLLLEVLGPSRTSLE